MQARNDEEGERGALQLVTELKTRKLIRGFGGAQQVPKRAYTLEELRLNKIEPQQYLSPVDETLNSVRTGLQVPCMADSEHEQHCIAKTASCHARWF